jgi:dihydropteroate synthase
MASSGEFLDLGVPILVGHSRKGFIGKSLEQALGRPATLEERDGGTAGSACVLAAAGVQIVRVHAVGLVQSALELYCCTMQENGASPDADEPD